MYAQYKEKMMPKKGKPTETMNLPWEVVDACNGFALDIGGSVMKFLFVDKKNYKEKDKREKDSMGQLCVKNFPHVNLVNDDAFEFLKENIYLKTTEGEKLAVHGTGFGTSVLGPKISEDFGVTVQCEEEASCFTRALAYMLKNLPRKDVLLKFDPKEEESIIAEGKATLEMTIQTKTMLGIRTANQDPIQADGLWFVESMLEAAPERPMAVEKDIFPCIIVMCGSASGSMLVQEDGSYDFVTDTSIGGKYWLGLGSVLTNAQNYGELMALAEKGNNEVVDITQADFAGDTGEAGTPAGETGGTPDEATDFYKAFQNSDGLQYARTVFSFAKVNQKNKDTFKKADIARAFLSAMTTDLVSVGMSAGRIERVRHVFYCGGFVSHPLVQNMMYRHWVRAWTELKGYDTTTDAVQLHFLKHSSNLGALGALLKNVNH